MKRKCNSEYTQNKICEIFIELLKQKDYKDITINAITEKCGINRTTFYLFYSSKRELMGEICNNILDWYIDDLIVYSNSNGEQAKEILRQDFLKLAKQSEIMRSLFKVQESTINPYLIMTNAIENALYKEMKEKIPEGANLELYCKFFAGDAITTVQWWVNNCNSYEVDYVVNIVEKCTKEGCNKILR